MIFKILKIDLIFIAIITSKSWQVDHIYPNPSSWFPASCQLNQGNVVVTWRSLMVRVGGRERWGDVSALTKAAPLAADKAQLRELIIASLEAMLAARTAARLLSGIQGPGRRLDLAGIFPPITTPFRQDEDIAFDMLAANLQVWETMSFKGTRSPSLPNSRSYKHIPLTCLHLLFQRSKDIFLSQNFSIFFLTFSCLTFYMVLLVKDHLILQTFLSSLKVSLTVRHHISWS